MLKIKIISVGKLKEEYLKNAVWEYTKRLIPFCNLEQIEVADVSVPSRPFKAQIDEVSVPLDSEGIIIKADNIGSLEALSVLLREKGFKIRRATVGSISKKDVTEAESNFESDELNAVILGFNIPSEPSSKKVKIITSKVIYHLIEEYEEWSLQKQKEIEARSLEGLMRHAKVDVLANFARLIRVF